MHTVLLPRSKLFFTFLNTKKRKKKSSNLSRTGTHFWHPFFGTHFWHPFWVTVVWTILIVVGQNKKRRGRKNVFPISYLKCEVLRINIKGCKLKNVVFEEMGAFFKKHPKNGCQKKKHPFFGCFLKKRPIFFF
jgi:hypothetical protein